MKSKSLIRNQVIFIVLTILNGGLFAQSHPFLNKFLATRIGDAVYLNWRLKAGSTCNGIQIYRSTDTLSFTKIYEISGVCGAAYESRSYDYTDLSPIKNKINYYRIGLNENGFSQIISLDIISFENDKFQIRPNPIVRESKIYFDNPKNKPYELSVYSLNGSKVFTFQTTNDNFEINGSSLIAGLYLFVISAIDDVQTMHGKFVVTTQ